MTASDSKGARPALPVDDFGDADGIVRIGCGYILESLALEMPCTRILMRSSGSLSMRMMMTIVPTL